MVAALPLPPGVTVPPFDSMSWPSTDGAPALEMLPWSSMSMLRTLLPLWVFFLFVAYLVIGTAIGVKVQGKPLNIEAVPHIHVWRQVGEMAGSGVAMARAKVNGRAAASSQYKGVDGAETSSLKGEVVDYGAADKGDYDTL